MRFPLFSFDATRHLGDRLVDIVQFFTLLCKLLSFVYGLIKLFHSQPKGLV